MYVSAHADDANKLELDTRPIDVLAIGSQLVHGSVGLNAALSVYNQAGLRCAALPTTVLSVLPHYPSTHRIDMDGSWLAHALDDLEESGALRQLRAVAVGYLPVPDHAAIIAQWYQSRPGPSAMPPLILDPTLGDIEVGFYNDPAIVAALRKELLPIATGVIPNLFELAQLTGGRTAHLSGDALEEAARSLLAEGPQWATVTGLLGKQTDGGENSAQISELVFVGGRAHMRSHHFVPSAAKGVGDVFTAALITQMVAEKDIIAAVDTAASITAEFIRGDRMSSKLFTHG